MGRITRTFQEQIKSKIEEILENTNDYVSSHFVYQQLVKYTQKAFPPNLLEFY